MEFVGKDTDWIVVWNCQLQTYFIYRKGKLFTKKYKYSDVKLYLN